MASGGPSGQARPVIDTGKPSVTVNRRLMLVAAPALVASLALLTYVTAATPTTARFNDFYREAWPPYRSLTHGHVLGFLQFGPTYVGSLILRAPFAMLPLLWGCGARAIYFASALPCMLALAGFCAWLTTRSSSRLPSARAIALSPVFVCIFNPITVVALFGGHPEEILGAVLCVLAVMLAVRGRASWAGLVLALAVVNKSWALVAVPVVFAALPASRRIAALTFLATCTAVLLPVVLARVQGVSSGVTASVAASPAAAQIGAIFNPPQLLWWFGQGAWIVKEARALIVLVPVAIAGIWWLRRGTDQAGASRLPQALLLLTLVLLLRAALDPWDNLYYHLPFVLSLAAYEASMGRKPMLALTCSIVLVIVVPIGLLPISGNVRAATYAVVVLPMLAWLAGRLFWPRSGYRDSLDTKPLLAPLEA